MGKINVVSASIKIQTLQSPVSETSKQVRYSVKICCFIVIIIYIYIYLARTPEIGQGLGRILSCGARKPEQT